MSIPKQLFQTWKTKNITNELKEITGTWQQKNKNYKYFLYDDDECENFIKNNFDNDVLSAYKKIIIGAFKADLWRVCILYQLGGFYCDIDTLCIGDIDSFIREDTKFIAAVDLNNYCPTGHAIFNAFMGAEKHSTIMQLCIDKIVHNVQNNITDIPAVDFTGCGIVGRSLNSYLENLETSSFIGQQDQWLDSGVVLLHFNREDEMIMDTKGQKLFQNKNKNPRIKKIYENQCLKDNVTYWFGADKWII